MERAAAYYVLAGQLPERVPCFTAVSEDCVLPSLEFGKKADGFAICALNCPEYRRNRARSSSRSIASERPEGRVAIHYLPDAVEDPRRNGLAVEPGHSVASVVAVEPCVSQSVA